MIQKYRKTVEFYLFLLFPALLSAAPPSDSGELAAYRSLVRDYSHELKSSGYSREMYAELTDRAEAEFYPSLQGGGSFQYTGNPLSLNKEIPGLSQPLTFTGQHEKYGVNLSLSQLIYTGGALKGNYEKAKYEQTSAGYRIEQTLNDITYDADCRYWTAVASRELTDVARHYRESVDMLVGVVRHRVEVEFADRNDLLMALVKLNNADYLLKQAENSAEVARLSLNSLAGVPFDEHISTDSVVIPLNAAALPAGDASADMRPELKIAGLQTDIRRAEGKIAMSEYMPKFSLHVDGSYSSPGYDFEKDLSPNYAVYVNLSVPLFEWGKRRNTRKATDYQISMAEEYAAGLGERISLEIQTARYNFEQAAEQVELTESSLANAAESEELSLHQYREGLISIVEVINAQVYHYQAKQNYIAAKLNAQMARCAYARAAGHYAE